MDLTWHEWLVAGIALVVLGSYLLWRFRDELTFSRRAKETDGVISNWFKMREKGKDFFYPLIDFTPEGGQRTSFRAEERSEGQPMYPPGTGVRVKYLPGNPKQVKVIYPPSK